MCKLVLTRWVWIGAGSDRLAASSENALGLLCIPYRCLPFVLDTAVKAHSIPRYLAVRCCWTVRTDVFVGGCAGGLDSVIATDICWLGRAGRRRTRTLKGRV